MLGAMAGARAGGGDTGATTGGGGATSRTGAGAGVTGAAEGGMGAGAGGAVKTGWRSTHATQQRFFSTLAACSSLISAVPSAATQYKVPFTHIDSPTSF